MWICKFVTVNRVHAAVQTTELWRNIRFRDQRKCLCHVEASVYILMLLV